MRLSSKDRPASPGAAKRSLKRRRPRRKKKGFGLANLTKSVSSGKGEQQVAASGGARGVGADRLAKGGDNPNLVKVAISPGELKAFKLGIA